MKKTLIIQGGEIFTPSKIFSPGTIIVENGKINTIKEGTKCIDESTEKTVVDASGLKVIPGFIDTHVHGRGGHDFGDSIETTNQILKNITKTGVTSVLPTIGAKPKFEQILDSIQNVITVKEKSNGGAKILGIHMEGPSFSKEKIARGSQPVRFLRTPCLDDLYKFFDAAKGQIKKIAIAPELNGAIDYIREARKLGIVVCAGHSSATYEETLRAIEAGLNCATHTFNGMLPFHHRKPGLIGAILTRDEINAEFIPDGQHISPVAIKLLIRCKELEHVHAVSDNTIYAGLPNGEYQDEEKDHVVVKEENKAYVKGGTLAGSVCPLNHGLKVLVEEVGLDFENAIQLLSINPAKVIGVNDQKGSLEPDKDADIVLIDNDFTIHKTFVEGDLVYES